LAEIEKLNQSIKKGKIKNVTKIEARLSKKAEKYKSASERYNTVLVIDENGKVLRVDATSKYSTPDPLAGCYVIESTHKSLDAVETWKLYMTLSRVENAFRSMKTTLGVRPIYHQKDDRSSAHLFIAVLAYHLLFSIERRLASFNDTRQWNTIRTMLSTHTRNTVVMNDVCGGTHHRRMTGKPEDIHQDIYKKLNVMDPIKTVTQCMNN
jgi:transposase